MFVDKEKGSRREGCHKQLPDRSLAELWAPELWQLKHRSRADPCLTLNCVYLNVCEYVAVCECVRMCMSENVCVWICV